MGILSGNRRGFVQRVLGETWPWWMGVGLLLLGMACSSNDPPSGPSSPKSAKGAKGPGAKGRPAPLVRTLRAAIRPMERTLSLTGRIEATKVARVASPAEGPVMNCVVREGDRVTRGKLLVRIGRSQATDASVDAAQQELRREEEALRRVEHLVQTGAIPGEELDRAVATHSRAQAALASAHEKRNDYRVAAPWDGVVSRVLVSDGNFVEPRAPLVDLYDPKSLVLRFSVPESRTAGLELGASVSARLDAYPQTEIVGSVVRIYPEVDRQNQTRTYEAQLDTDLPLVPGMFARFAVSAGQQSVLESISIPLDALITDSVGQGYLFVVQDGKAVRRNVETGLESGGWVQVQKGLSEGEPVVVSGAERLRPGSSVRLMPDDADSGGKNEEKKAGNR